MIKRDRKSMKFFSLFKVTFKGIAGSGYRGDIAVDDVQFTTLSCVLEPPEADPNRKSTTQPPTTYPRTRRMTQGIFQIFLISNGQALELKMGEFHGKQL